MRTFGSEYALGEEIGSGGYAKVHRCINRATGQVRAVKIIPNSGKINPMREAMILSKLKSRTIPRLYDVYEHDNKTYIVMELCSGISLFHFINKNAPLPENSALIISRQIFDTINYLHKQNVAHLDIKPENILIEPNSLSIKLIDFGFATENVHNCEEYRGSMNYAAPELFSHKPFDAKKADVWSVGIVHYVMVMGSLPFSPVGQKPVDQLKAICSGIHKPLPKSVGNISTCVIDQALVLDPLCRKGAEELFKELVSVGPPRCLRVSSNLSVLKSNQLLFRVQKQRRSYGAMM